MIEVSHLTRMYGARAAVKDLSFTVEDGQIYGLLGPNGAGKSTIMNILAGYLAATSGTVTVCGHPLPEEADAARACVGYLPETPPLYPEMTVEEYLRFAAALKGVRRAGRKAQVEKAARRTGLTGVMPRLIRNLSKGYRQRVGIAQALLGDPRVIILDEPTVGLDPIQIIEIRELIRQLGQNHTVILSSHILSEVQAICDKILIINKGKLIAFDTPERLEKQLLAPSEITLTAEGTEETVRSILGEISHITSLETVPDGEERTTVRLKTDLEDIYDLSRQLFFVFAGQQVPLLELALKKTDLEDIFLELTEQPAEGPTEEEGKEETV